MNIDKDTEKIMPYAYTYANWEDEAKGEKKAKIIEDKLTSMGDFKELTISYSMLKNKVRTVRHIILSNTMYNAVADFLGREKISLSDEEYFLVGVDGKKEPILKDAVKDVIFAHAVTKDGGSDKRIISVSSYFTSVTVVSDKKYEEISKDLVKDKIYAFTQKDLTKGKGEDLENIRKAIGFEEGKESLISYNFYYDFENLTRKLVSYVGSILCVSFLIGIASIIYSRLYSSVEEESKKYSKVDICSALYDGACHIMVCYRCYQSNDPDLIYKLGNNLQYYIPDHRIDFIYGYKKKVPKEDT